MEIICQQPTMAAAKIEKVVLPVVTAKTTQHDISMIDYPVNNLITVVEIDHQQEYIRESI